MKIELIKETKLTDDPFYAIYLNGKYIAGSYNEKRALEFYERVKENPSQSGNIVLKSEVINVPSQENN